MGQVPLIGAPVPMKSPVPFNAILTTRYAISCYTTDYTRDKIRGTRLRKRLTKIYVRL